MQVGCLASGDDPRWDRSAWEQSFTYLFEGRRQGNIIAEVPPVGKEGQCGWDGVLEVHAECSGAKALGQGRHPCEWWGGEPGRKGPDQGGA